MAFESVAVESLMVSLTDAAAKARGLAESDKVFVVLAVANC